MRRGAAIADDEVPSPIRPISPIRRIHDPKTMFPDIVDDMCGYRRRHPRISMSMSATWTTTSKDIDDDVWDMVDDMRGYGRRYPRMSSSTSSDMDDDVWDIDDDIRTYR